MKKKSRMIGVLTRISTDFRYRLWKKGKYN